MANEQAEKNYPQLLCQLKLSLESAAAKQEYHRLLDLDNAVRMCATEAVSACAGNDSLSQRVAIEIKELMNVYKRVSQLCSDKSDSLKAEARKINYKKRGAQQYLNVGSNFR